jgi:hypothetical protein
MDIPKIKNPRRKQRGIEDFSLKSLLMRGIRPQESERPSLTKGKAKTA